MASSKPLVGGNRASFIAIGTLVFFCSCAGPSISSQKKLNELIAAQDYPAADSYLDRLKITEFGKKNAVLFYLDKGAVQHYAGLYKDSNESLTNAENRMEELYTKSVSKTAGMFIFNDNTVDYMGQPFERAIASIMRSLNYALVGNIDDALVESRNVELFLDTLNQTMGNKNSYKDDAFARYLDSLYYADDGQFDDARISMDAATKAYQWYAADYRTPEPKFDFSYTFDSQGQPQGELVFIHYNGVAPRKVSKTFQVAWGEGLAMARQQEQTQGNNPEFDNAISAGVLGNAITVSYPAYVQDHFNIASSAVTIDSSGPSASTELMEDISAIAIKDLGDRQALIKTRAVARAVIKYAIAQAASIAAGRVCDKQFGAGSIGATVCRFGTRGLAQGTAAATEYADTRGWTTLPSQIRMARLKLAPGKHDVLVSFKNARGQVISTHLFKDVQISNGKRTYLSFRTAI